MVHLRRWMWKSRMPIGQYAYTRTIAERCVLAKWHKMFLCHFPRFNSSLLDRWLDYKAVGRRLEGTRFIAFKVPLKKVSGPTFSSWWWTFYGSSQNGCCSCLKPMLASVLTQQASTSGHLWPLGTAGRFKQRKSGAWSHYWPDFHYPLLYNTGIRL